MDRNAILEKYRKEEDKLLVSKLFDKISAVDKQNKIQYTDFLSPIELQILKKVLNSIKYQNYIIYGVTSNSQRNIIILFPSKLEEVFSNNNFDFNSICNTIRITNVNENMEHKRYLGGLVKLGVKREKIGDIIVHEDGADIIVLKEVTKFLISNLQQLTRFKSAEIEVIDVSETLEKEQEFEEMKIISSSLRLDNIVSELAKTSRSKAVQILEEERVFINYENVNKSTKIIKQNDIITIRGIGKFIVDEIAGNTRSGRFIIIIKKYK